MSPPAIKWGSWGEIVRVLSRKQVKTALGKSGLIGVSLLKNDGEEGRKQARCAVRISKGSTCLLCGYPAERELSDSRRLLSGIGKGKIIPSG